MGLSTLTVGTAVTPTVIETWISHYLKRKPHHQKPTAHISYHEGLQLIRQFLDYASHHTVEDLQSFTSQWVPCPRWVKVEEVAIPEKSIGEAADAICAQLGHRGVDKVGGEKWWQWRREETVLQAEWVEMRRDYTRRKQWGESSKRIMLYVHGGAYFFGSVDEHRYQIQRHARKLEARVLARLQARYRLAPQFPFPCGLHDCLAAYLYLLTVQSPTEIILAGDSAGGGMILSVLVILRDRGLPLPGGAILISPWVDLTHSFPSVAEDGSRDYIPAHGFMQRPSASWPPPNSDDMAQIAKNAIKEFVDESLPRKSTQEMRRKAEDEAVQGFATDRHPKDIVAKVNLGSPAGLDGADERLGSTITGAGHDLSIMIDGRFISIKDQIQMYTTNQLLSHPLVSPVLQPSLGGLPPLLIMVGGGEVLRDEQIYLAHKAANPSKYRPSEVYLDDYPGARDNLANWKPTDVQLQVWDDLCHVAPTLSFTRPAKFMYRSIAQFGAWALARAQKRDIEIQDDDDISVISSSSDTGDDINVKRSESTTSNSVTFGDTVESGQIGKAGDSLPAFKNHMIRQRVDRHGNIFPLAPASSLPACRLSPNEIGVIKPGPVQKWLKAKQQWDTKYAKEKRKVQKQRTMEMVKGYSSFGDDEVPPPSALAGRRGLHMPKEEKKSRSWGMSLWSLWGSSHDETTISREEKADKQVATTATTPTDGTGEQSKAHDRNQSRSKSRRRTVTYHTPPLSSSELIDTQTREKEAHSAVAATNTDHQAPPAITTQDPEFSRSNIDLQRGNSQRPFTAGGGKFPFKLGSDLMHDGRNASTITLMSQGGVVTPKGEAGEAEKGLGAGGKRRMTLESEGGVLFKGAVPERKVDEGLKHDGAEETSQKPKADALGSSDVGVLPAAVEERRGTMQEERGTLYKASVPVQPQQKEVDGGNAEIEAIGSSNYGVAKDSGDDDLTPPAAVQERRGTVQDDTGVLHHGTVGGIRQDDAKGKDADERPGLERFETAKEEV